MKKINVNLFLRKPVYGRHFSVENFYKELFVKKNNFFKFNLKISPFYSKGLINRLLIIIWGFFNQGDINHVCGDINFISLLFKKSKTINTFLDFYSIKRLTGIKKKIFNFFWIKIPLLKSSKVIVISSKIKEELMVYNKIHPSKIFVSNICVNDIFKKKKKKKKFNKIKKFLIIGTSQNKNLKNIFLALKNLKCELIIIGLLTDKEILILNKLNINYKNYVGISQNLVFKKYQECDLLLFISKYEGFGMPIIEAQTVGRVVITSNINPMKDIAGKGALLVNPNDVNEIRLTILKVLNNKTLRSKLIKEGYKNIKKYEKKYIFNKHLEYYKSILNSNE